MTKTVDIMTPGELKRRYHVLRGKNEKLTDIFIADGLGDMRFSDMVSDPERHPRIPEYLEIARGMEDIMTEGRRRYGPNLASIDHLSRIHKPIGKRWATTASARKET